MTGNNLQRITKAIALVKDYPNNIIEATVIEYVCSKIGKTFYYTDEFSELKNVADQNLMWLLGNIEFPVDIEFIIEFFEALLEKENVTENGIVFTPKYIADYINDCVLQDIDSDNVKSIDPGCGCGIFLVSASEKLKTKSGRSLVDILGTSIYGIDIDKDNARRCKIVLNLFVLINGESNEELKLNILCTDSLKADWKELFGVEGFSCIIGNPPYVNTHDMNKETAQFLKKTFKTTKIGVYSMHLSSMQWSF